MDKETSAIINGLQKLIEEKFSNFGEKLDSACTRFAVIEKYTQMLGEIEWERRDLKRKVWSYFWKIAIAAIIISLGFPKVVNAAEYISNIITQFYG